MKDKMIDCGPKLSIEDIKIFETEHNLKFTELYTKFLLEYNGGYPEIFDVFKIEEANNESVVNGFYIIKCEHRYNDLHESIDSLEDAIPSGFIPIGYDPGGNQICLGLKEPYYEQIYFWDHHALWGDEDGNPHMDNMYFLANNIYEFLDSLYENTDDDEE